MKNEKGITLVSLVIMIIVILIISSIAIKTSTNSIDLANYTAFQTELKIMQIKANELQEKNIINVGENLTVENQNILNKQEVSQELEKKAQASGKNILDIKNGFKLYTQNIINNALKLENITQDFLVNTKDSIVIAVTPYKYEGIDYYMSEQMEDSIYNVTYKNQVSAEGFKTIVTKNPENNKNQINIEIINPKNISKWEIEYQLKGTSYKNKTNKLTFDVDKKGTYIITVKHGDELKFGPTEVQVI